MKGISKAFYHYLGIWYIVVSVTTTIYNKYVGTETLIVIFMASNLLTFFANLYSVSV